MKGLKTKAEESIRLAYTGLRHSCCHTYIDTLELYQPRRKKARKTKRNLHSQNRLPARQPFPPFSRELGVKVG